MRSKVCSFLIALACCACSAPSVSLIPRFGSLDVDGDIGVNASSSNLSTTNSVEDLGLQKDDEVFSGRADLDFGGVHLSLALSDSSHGGEGTLEAELSDGDTTIAAGTDVTSTFDLLLGDLMCTFDLVPGDTFEFGLGLGATAADVDAEFKDELTGDDIKTHELIPLPLVCARAGVRLGRFDASALLGGMDLSVDGDRAQYLDLDLMGRVRLLGRGDHFNGALVIGYRWIDVDVEYDDDDRNVQADLTFSGPYVGVSLNF